MKLTELCNGIKIYSNFLDDGGCATATPEILQLVETLEINKNATISKISLWAKSMPAIEPKSTEGKTVQNIKSSLDDLISLLEPFVSKAVLRDIKKINELLEGHEKYFFADYNATLKNTLGNRLSKSAKTTKPRDEKLVSTILSQLEGAASDLGAFNSVLEAMKKNRAIRLHHELKAIANQFYGVDFKFKSKKEAFDLIVSRQKRDEEDARERKNSKNVPV